MQTVKPAQRLKHLNQRQRFKPLNQQQNLNKKQLAFRKLQTTNHIFANKLKYPAKSHPLYQFIRPVFADVDVVLQQRV